MGIGVNPGRLGVATLPDFGQGALWGSQGVAGGWWGSWTGRKILL